MLVRASNLDFGKSAVTALRVMSALFHVAKYRFVLLHFLTPLFAIMGNLRIFNALFY